ncbi:MAG TPA: FAD-dependent monooxygenase [Steroidobacteraceae bacterium]|nr:FAD-dependent monooxygenase [Steroidobacteraceae bacterium]
MNPSTEVLVVGAGPTGLMLATQLGRRGIRAKIIDRHTGPAEQTRAMGVHARTLEIYEKLGIAGRALELGRVMEAGNIWVRGRPKARIPLGVMGKGVSRYPFMLMLGQDDNERILGDRLRDFGVAVQWQTELLALERQPDHVVAQLRGPDGSVRTVTARYVAGCDGARSAVRELSGIGFPGAPYEHVFFVADTEATGPMVPGELNVYMWHDGFHLYFPMRGADHWRVIGILPQELRAKEGVTFEDVMPSLRGEGGGQIEFRSCAWFSTYRIHHRVTERFRSGRCFLLGDAAHVHSPMGAQGMNTGLQDAYNLAWKLALVVNGQAGDALLDSYEAERLPVAQRLLGTTDRAFQFVVSKNRIGSLFRTRILPNVAAFAMSREAARRIAFRTLSQTGIAYHRSPLSQALGGLAKDSPQPGDRFPWLHLRLRAGRAREDLFQCLDDTRFNLLVFGQPARVEALNLPADLLAVHEIADDGENADELARVGIKGPAFYLLRPDGHVGLAGTRLDMSSVMRWFASAHLDVGAPIPWSKAS